MNIKLRIKKRCRFAAHLFNDDITKITKGNETWYENRVAIFMGAASEKHKVKNVTEFIKWALIVLKWEEAQNFYDFPYKISIYGLSIIGTRTFEKKCQHRRYIIGINFYCEAFGKISLLSTLSNYTHFWVKFWADSEVLVEYWDCIVTKNFWII